MSTSSNNINLLPESRIMHRQRARVISRWALALMLGAFVCGLPVLVVTISPHGADNSLVLRTVENAERSESAMLENQALQKKLVALSTQSEAVRMLERRVDWSGIFRGLASAANGRAWLDHIECGTDQDQRADRIEVQIRGFADSQGAARGFVVAIEELGLFDEIVLNDTTRMVTQEVERVRFQITLVLDPQLIKSGGGG